MLFVPAIMFFSYWFVFNGGVDTIFGGVSDTLSIAAPADEVGQVERYSDPACVRYEDEGSYAYLDSMYGHIKGCENVRNDRT